MKHVKTDPACLHHRPPRTWWQRWRFERGHGHECPICTLGLNIAQWMENSGPAWTGRVDDADGQNPRG